MARTSDYAAGTPSTKTKLLGSEDDGSLRNYDLDDIKNQISNTYLRAEVELTAAQMIAETEVEIIAIAGVGKYVVIQDVSLFYDYGTAQFTATDADIVFTLNSNSVLTADIDTKLTGLAVDGVWKLVLNTAGEFQSDVAADFETYPIKVAVTNTDLAAGDGSLKIVVYYTIEDV